VREGLAMVNVFLIIIGLLINCILAILVGHVLSKELGVSFRRTMLVVTPSYTLIGISFWTCLSCGLLEYGALR
jgi:hypothetical protein